MNRTKIVCAAMSVALGSIPAGLHAQSVSPGELAQKRDALVAQCPVTPVLPEADAAKLPIHVTRWGNQGPRVVIIHGGVQGRLGGGPATFDKQDAWGREGFRVERVDRPGFGQSPTRGDDDMERDAVWIADMLGDGANLIGHSWGGAEVLLAAARRPEAVLSLVLVEPAVSAVAEADPALRDDPAVRAGAAQRTKVMSTAKTPAEYARMFSGVLGAASAPSSAPSGASAAAAGLGDEEAGRMGCALLKGRIAPAAVLQQAINTIAAAGVPVLVVTGGWNAGFDGAGGVLARLVHGKHIIVRSPNHFVPLENSADFNREVGTFMHEADQRRRDAGLK